jgi:hypothetical protein
VPVSFDPGAGGVVCAACGERGVPVMQGTVGMMKFLQDADVGGLRSVRADGKMLREARALLGDHVAYHCGRAPKSSSVIDSLS